MSSNHPVQVIAVTGGKGGVGKTNVSINLSVCLAEMGRRVALLDADLGLANVDVLLGLTPKQNLENVLAGECSLSDIMLEGPGGIQIIPASSGTQEMTMLGSMQHAGLIHAFSELAEMIDVLIVDTAAGISDSVVSFVRASHEVLLVVCDEPSSLTDAYAWIKLLNRDFGVERFRENRLRLRTGLQWRCTKRRPPGEFGKRAFEVAAPRHELELVPSSYL